MSGAPLTPAGSKAQMRPGASRRPRFGVTGPGAKVDGASEADDLAAGTYEPGCDLLVDAALGGQMEERALIVQDDDVRAARSLIARDRPHRVAWPTRERLADFGQRWPARSPSLVDLVNGAVKPLPRALDRSLGRPYPDGCETADHDRLGEGRFEHMKDKAP